MIEKRTIVDQIEVTISGHVQIRFAVQLVEHGRVIEQKWHRTAVEPGGDVDAQLALVSENLEALGKARLVDAAGVRRVKDIAQVVHTPEAVAEYRARLQAPHAEMKLNP